VNDSERLRLIVASPMKSASTFVAETLRRYFGADVSNRDIVGYYFPAEQNLTSDLLDQLEGRSFSINLHLRPYPHNMESARRRAISVVVLWRNLGDLIVSFDDHVRNESELNPVFYIADRARYLALPPHERYTYLIDSLVPWKLGFYLAWRRQGVTLHPYERLVESPFDYLSGIIRELGHEPDAERLHDAIPRDGVNVRLNVGSAGRSAGHLTESNRRHLERVVLDHPQRHELEVLLWELPWEVPVLGPPGPHDGALVRGAGGAMYFVSRGVRRRLDGENWLRSRARLNGESARELPADELAALPEAGALA
jgi:hypothetical protein